MAKSPYARFGTVATSGEGTAKRHIVVGGETLMSIAAHEHQAGYDSELWRQIAEENDIDDVDGLTVNTALVIPRPAASET